MSSKILYIVSGRSFSSKNPGRKIHEVISVWLRLGINVNLLFGKDINGIKEDNFDYGSQNYHNASFRKKKYLKYFINSASELKDIIHNQRIYSKIKRDYSNTDLDLIWERSSRLHWAGLKLAKLKNIPFVLEWKDHLIDYKFSFFKWFATYIEAKKIKDADYIVVESNVLKQELIIKGVPVNKIKVALNAVNPLEFKRDLKKGNELKDKLGIKQTNIVVGYLGSYAFYHNPEMLIEAAKLVLENQNNVSFLLVGNGLNYKKCKSLAEEYHLFEKGLIMIDGVAKEKVPDLLSCMDITVLPGSTDIICPIKVMEYMAAETAVLVPNYLCNQEVMRHGHNGLLFEPKNPIDLSANIVKLLNSQGLIKKLAEKARRDVSENLIWKKTWGKILIEILENENIN